MVITSLWLKSSCQATSRLRRVIPVLQLFVQASRHRLAQANGVPEERWPILANVNIIQSGAPYEGVRNHRKMEIENQDKVAFNS